jgi:hypothetical protein
MNKDLLFSAVACLFSIAAFSQVSQETIEYNKKKHTAFKMEYDYPPVVVQNALVQHMEQLGYRGREEKGILNRDKGFMVHQGAFVTEVNEKSMDYIFKIDPRAKKDKTGSIIYMVIMKDGENAAPAFSDTEVGRVRSFLTGLAPAVESTNLEMQIKGQEEGVAKSEKKFRTLQADSLNLENKIRDLYTQLDKVIRNQQFQQKEIENQKRLLEEMKGKRK